ncbi:hypothetical protein BSQ39_09090 [Loigolactobacillus backii]|uniref:hypothetical protein n=1 Tax=Loigolactobacillus backii TaxID=375175 RepID=UPI000C1CA03B|nr:hypothetical protein [Loigolactobacillus backii]PIO83710.1 hypothetical protein BSQ39_09090 [Loigolactobacillus backii]
MKKILKIFGVIILAILGIVIVFHIILWLASLVGIIFSLIVTGFEWLVGIAVAAYLIKFFLFGNSSRSRGQSKKKKPFFVSDARDGVSDARRQIPDARDNIPDARDNISHPFKNERDRRRW